MIFGVRRASSGFALGGACVAALETRRMKAREHGRDDSREMCYFLPVMPRAPLSMPREIGCTDGEISGIRRERTI